LSNPDFFDDFPLAYHLTFGTYGTRLHGDERGTVDRAMNQPGDPVIGRDEDWERMERNRLVCEPVLLTPEQRGFIERELPSICARGGWEPHAVAAAPNHVHVSLSARVEGKAIRKWLKRWLGEAIDGDFRTVDFQLRNQAVDVGRIDDNRTNLIYIERQPIPPSNQLHDRQLASMT
jgi:hypothetical protein